MNKKNILKKISNKIKVPKFDGLGIPRRNMPQIKNKFMGTFQDWLESENISFEEVSISAKELKPTQKDFNLKKVEKLLRNTDDPKLKKFLLISKDNYILDGHHKWLVNLNLDENKKINCLQVDLNIKDFLDKVKKFPKIRYKDLDDNVYKKTDPKLKYASKKKQIIKKVIAKINLAKNKDDFYKKI
jgi:hypothetical protein